MKNKAIRINAQDNVSIALQELEAESYVKVEKIVEKIRIKDRIPFGHKFAIMDIKIGENITKHGEIIGRATKNVMKGQHIHIQNIESLRVREY